MCVCVHSCVRERGVEEEWVCVERPQACEYAVFFFFMHVHVHVRVRVCEGKREWTCSNKTAREWPRQRLKGSKNFSVVPLYQHSTVRAVIVWELEDSNAQRFFIQCPIFNNSTLILCNSVGLYVDNRMEPVVIHTVYHIESSTARSLFGIDPMPCSVYEWLCTFWVRGADLAECQGTRTPWTGGWGPTGGTGPFRNSH